MTEESYPPGGQSPAPHTVTAAEVSSIDENPSTTGCALTLFLACGLVAALLTALTVVALYRNRLSSWELFWCVALAAFSGLAAIVLPLILALARGRSPDRRRD